MAVKEIEGTKCKYNEIKVFEFETATVAEDGFEIIFQSNDEENQILVYNSDDTNTYKVTVKVPENGTYAGAREDLELELEKGEYAIIRLESAKYADSSGVITLIPENVAVKATLLY